MCAGSGFGSVGFFMVVTMLLLLFLQAFLIVFGRLVE